MLEILVIREDRNVHTDMADVPLMCPQRSCGRLWLQWAVLVVAAAEVPATAAEHFRSHQARFAHEPVCNAVHVGVVVSKAPWNQCDAHPRATDKHQSKL